jgi:hypothetical protein
MKRACEGSISIGLFLLGAVLGVPAAAAVVDFEELALSPESFYNGADGAGGFTSGGARFNNTFTDFGGGFTSWSGWSYSNRTDTKTPGFENQYSAFAGGGAGGSQQFGVSFASTDDLDVSTIELPAGARPLSVQITNTTYAALSVQLGDAFAKKFGGASGTDPDYFRLTITGRRADDAPVGTVEFYLADYRPADSGDDYVVDAWTPVDLSPLDGAAKLSFTLASSDVGQFGMNTPAYFALDNLLLSVQPGDATGDDAVGLDDFGILKANFGQPGHVGQGDFSGDAHVDLTDFGILKSNFGTPAPVPEPGAATLACLGAALLARRRRPQRCRQHANSPRPTVNPNLLTYNRHA